MEKTLGVSKLSFDCLNSTVFSGDVCVALFNGLPGSKARCDAKPLMEEKKNFV